MTGPPRAARPPAAHEVVLAEAVRRLVNALHPERIYLFGSRARGEATEDSDFDLMLISSDDDGLPRREQERLARDALRDLEPPLNAIVRTSSGFERDSVVVASLAATVAREGRLLYGSPPPERSFDRMDVEARRAQLAREWMARAHNDLRTAEATMATRPPILDAVVYHCQQAFEKVLKAFLTWHDRPFRRTHELPELVGWCADVDPDFAHLLESAALVSPYAWKFRYPIEDDDGVVLFLEPTADEAENALGLTRHALDFVLARLPEAARP